MNIGGFKHKPSQNPDANATFLDGSLSLRGFFLLG